MHDMRTTATHSGNLWHTRTRDEPIWSPLNGNIDVEIAVVGGGVIGAATALHLAREGVSVALVDGKGAYPPATCSSGGIVAPQLVRATPSDIVRRLGGAAGEGLLSLYGEAGRYSFSLIAEEGIECAAVQGGFLAPYVTGRQAAFATQAVQEWLEFRDDVRVIDGAETARLSGCTGYAGAVLDESGGALDPLAYRDGLLRRAAHHGARLFSDTVIAPVSRTDTGYRLSCTGGQITARRVVLAANAGNRELWPKLAQSILPLPVYEVATEILPDDLRRRILPEGHSLTDLQTDIFTIRFDRDGRLITACPPSDDMDRGRIEEQINQRLKQMIPGWHYIPIDHLWMGTAWLNTNLIPRIARCDEGVIAVQADNGRGLGMAAVIGREAARWAVDPTIQTAVPMAAPKRVAGYFIARHVPRLIMMAAKLKRALPLSPR